MEKEIKIAAKLYLCRDTAKRYFGSEYEDTILPCKRLITERQKVTNKPVLEVLIECLQLKSVQDNAMAMMMFNAAAIEIIESK